MYTRKVSKLQTPAKNLRHVELDGGDAFVPDPRHGFVPMKDDDAEAFGEEFIAAATSAEAIGEAARDELLEQDLDGVTIESPFDESVDEYFDAVDRQAS